MADQLGSRPTTHSGVVPFCFQLSNFLFPLKKLLPAHIEFFCERCKLLESGKTKGGINEKTGKEFLVGRPSISLYGPRAQEAVTLCQDVWERGLSGAPEKGRATDQWPDTTMPYGSDPARPFAFPLPWTLE
jgi:hypothetical protein